MNKRLESANLDREKELIKKQIESLENKINEIVYNLYGLSEEDKEVIIATLDREIKIAAAFQSLLDSIEKIWKSKSKLAINPRAVNTISR